MERNLKVAAVAVFAAAVTAATALRWDDENEPVTSSADSKLEQPGNTSESPAPAPSARKITPRPSSPIADRRDDALLAHIEHKYRYLLADVESAHVEELKRRLLEREGEMDIARRASTDARVGELLSPRGLAYYQALKDSDREQHHVAEYTGGISNVAPLDERQERQVLDAKLRQQQRYAAALRDVGLDRDVLSEAEREYARKRIAEALQNALNDFLVEISASLTEEQYTLLRNYETTELERELRRVQERINAKQ